MIPYVRTYEPVPCWLPVGARRSTGSFTGEEVTRGLESSDGVDWLLKQCSAAHCDNGIVAQYCGVISAAMECNTAVYHLEPNLPVRQAPAVR
eukprot:COSAG01_NODE_2264_length_8047_cov_18.774409_1_plen_92_part_00